MQQQEYKTMRHVEDTYWWYAILRTAVLTEIHRLIKSREAKIVDAGCGTGGTLDYLKKEKNNWELFGVDISEEAVAFSKERGLERVVQGDVAKLPYKNDSMDGIVCLDVLYHKAVDETQAITEFFRVLKPGGFLIVNMNAFKLLRGTHDVAIDSARRYTRAQVRTLLQGVGFEVEREQYWNAWLFFPVMAWRLLSRMHIFHTKSVVTKSDLKLLPPWINCALSKLGRLDFELCRMLSIPFGTSIFTVARKRGK